MSRIIVGPTRAGQKALGIEIAHLRGLDTRELQARWRVTFRRPAPPHLSDQLLFRVLAYRLQSNHLGDLNRECLKILNNQDSARTAGGPGPKLLRAPMERGTTLCREWNGRMHRVAAISDGFVWNGKTYTSLSKVAFAITGTRWNGPRFFGLRDRPKAGSPGSP